MENPFSDFPQHDSFSDNIPCSDQFLFCDQSPSLGLPELPSTSEPRLFSWSVPASEIGDVGDDQILHPYDSLSDSFLLDMIDEPIGDTLGNFEGGESGFNGESGGQENVDNCQNIPQSTGFGNPVQIPVWPIPPSPYNCSCCQILREIIHTNGTQVKNLEIHGRLGIISHAVLDKFDFDVSSENHEYQMFDFCKESIASVKNFLVQYCKDCKREGYSMTQDPLSNFYQALCIGINDNDNLASDNVLQPPSMVPGDFQMNEQDLAEQQEAESDEVRPTRAERSEAGPSRSNLATQRERAGKLKLKDFSEYFHLRMTDAAKELNVCSSVVKKKCREGGLSRWPYRKITGIKRKLTQKKESLTACTDEERVRTLAEIQKLERELADIFSSGE